MPSPFPGMDPYLEDPGLWPDVHHRLITVASDLLTEQLRPKYYVRIEERVYVSDGHDPGRRVIAPDIRVVSRSAGSLRSAGAHSRRTAAETEGAVTVVEPLEVTTLIEDQIHEPRIEVIDREGRQVVAVIEVLSPTNKVPGARGRNSYEQKRSEIMCSSSHFIEVDLLRDGEGFPPYEALPPHDYRVHLSPAQRRPRGLIWAIRLEQRLPVIPVPLRDNDPDACLDLQEIMDATYDRAAYDLELDYRADPRPPLKSDQAQWAHRLLREKGVR